MVYRAYIPRPPLSRFVDLFWYHGGEHPPHARERRLPTGTVELIFDLRDDGARGHDGQEGRERFRGFGGALVCGPHSGFFVIDTAVQASVMGAHFKPGGALPFLGVAAHELRDAHVPLEALWGARAGELRQRLLEAGTPQAGFRVLEESLSERAMRPARRHPAHPAVAFALEEFRYAPHARKVSEVRARTGLSARRFIRLFDEEVGLTPKLFCRVRRFQEALCLIEDGRGVGWADLALASGYFDQAHFARDFRGFSGLTPTAYLARRGEHRNHVALVD